MNGFAKVAIGAIATSLLAWGSHAVTGEAYIDGIEGEAQEAFAGLEPGEGASVAMQRDPLSRMAVVSGVDDPAERDRIRAALLTVPGVKSVSFGDEGEEFTGPSIDAEQTTSAEVSDCQDNVDAVMADKVITFRSGSAYMPDSSLAVVDEVAAVLTECPGLAVRVEGHTDARGSNAINATMSQERADRVAAALAERGIDASRITAEGLGSSQPVMEGTSAEANAANRRIAFTVSAGSILREGGEE
ncbi:OmpA family protein [Aurantiacibacter sp. D1-12]|uniref:OmpA family protein n=1 Tax=Aurantiacibacter sp. D1-12 TaxID=2993658 RepID=UPI00237D0CCA|nr:OmpA family protein [Aurantiacibacter sp. D1-12]MDE1467032.1 OmpA family protein [Aurantiacibacter sp. D1-12]